MGDRVQIRLARKNGALIAAVLTLRHRSTVVYKYGCSDEEFHNLGGMPFLFWRLIEESKAAGVENIDFGRSDLDNEGLVVFKDKFGAARGLLTYYRYPEGKRGPAVIRWNLRAFRPLLSLLPDAVFSAAGRALYKHVG
jgi:lipid II:glycine glycyltransferase (peptidoglycan interpeptide bridge formation enzyme)